MAVNRRSRRRLALVGSALVLALVGAVAPAGGAVGQSVTTTEVAGFRARDGVVRQPVRSSTFAVSGVADPVPTVIADAGDSSSVRIGAPARVEGIVTGGRGPYTVAWSYAGSNERFGSPDRLLSQFDTSGLAPGVVTLRFDATDTTGETASDTVKLHLWEPIARTLVDESVTTGPGVPDEQDPTFGLLGIDNSGTLDGETHEYPFTVATGTLGLELDLSWTSHESATVPDPTGALGEEIVTVNANDYDLYVDDPSDVEDENTSGATGAQPEHISIDAPAAGEWTARVAAFLVTEDTYRLTVRSTEQPADPVPTISTNGPYTFRIGDEQRLAATVAGGTAPLVTAWDTDLDGVFESPGTSTVTDFGEGTHLVSVKTTDAVGYERRNIVGVRVVAADAPAPPPVVVIGLNDTGINVYHDDFGATTYPDSRLLAATDGFTAHPSTYIDGFPASTPALPITLGQGYLPAQDADLFTRENIPLDTLFWVPGTKIVGVRDGGDLDDHDLLPILDDEYVPEPLEAGPGHGTASASVAAGNVFGYCPTCLVVFGEDINGTGAAWMYDQPWIDIVSASYSPQSNIGGAGLIPFIDGMPKEAAERGQLGLFAAGNGNENGFITPEQTYTSDLAGPGWAIRVGAAVTTSRKPVLGTGKPVDITSWGAGNIPAASYEGTSVDSDLKQHGGTSAATPYTSGVFGTVLAAAREALGDESTGQRGNGVVARGTPVATSPYLADGELTATELREVVFKTAEHDTSGNVSLLPTTTPYTPAQFLVEGYGIAEPASAQRAIDVLLGAEPLPIRTAEDAFFAADQAIRTTLWGNWSGGANSSAEAAAAQHQAAATLDMGALAGLTPAAVADAQTAVEVLDRVSLAPHPTMAAAAATQAAGTGATYYLHHLGGCVDGADPGPFMDTANTTGDDDGCGSAGTAGLADAEVESWTATAPLGMSAPAGSAIDGAIYLSSYEPKPASVTVTLLAGGQTVGEQTVDIISLGVAEYVAGNGYVPVPFSFPTTKALNSSHVLTLSVRLFGSATQFFGYEDDHASSFTVTPASEGGGGGSGTLGVTIDAPAEGLEVDPAVTPLLSVSGAATFPDVAGPAARFYPKWPDDGADGCTAATRLDADPDVVDSGCSNLAQALGATGLIEIRESYPLGAAALPVTLSATAPVEGTLFLGSVTGAPASVRVELVTLEAGQPILLGSQVVESVVLPTTAGANPVTAAPFSFTIDPSYAGVALGSLSLEVAWQRDGVSYLERDDPDSFVDLPVAAPGGGRVELSLDDDAFADPIATTLGDDGTWGAQIATAGLAPGTHTLRARAVQGTSVSAVATRTFTITGDGTPPAVDGVQVQVTRHGAVPTATGWLAAADTSPTKDLSTWVAQVSVPATGVHQVHARLVIGGREVARSQPVTFTRR